jgi:hypothetical protein
VEEIKCGEHVYSQFPASLKTPPVGSCTVPVPVQLAMAAWLQNQLPDPKKMSEESAIEKSFFEDRVARKAGHAGIMEAFS